MPEKSGAAQGLRLSTFRVLDIKYMWQLLTCVPTVLLLIHLINRPFTEKGSLTATSFPVDGPTCPQLSDL